MTKKTNPLLSQPAKIDVVAHAAPVEPPPFCCTCFAAHAKKQQCKPSDLKRRTERAISEAAEAEAVCRILVDNAGIPHEVIESAKAIAQFYLRK
jgi:hypothetical protein